MVVAAKAVAIAMVVVVAAAIVVKAPVAVPRTADPAADADQPKPPEAAAVVAALEPKPLVAVANQKQNVDLAKTLAAAPRAPPAKTMK